MRRGVWPGLALGMSLAVLAGDARAQEPRPEGRIDLDGVVVTARGGGNSGVGADGSESHFRDFAEVTRGAEKIDGLFTLHKKGDHLYAEVRPDQFNQPLLLPVTIAKGMAQAGMPVGDDDMVLVFKRVGDKVQLVRRNIHYKATAGTPLDKAVKQNYVDSVLMALPIVSINMRAGGAALIDLADIFLTDFAQLGLGPVDRSRSGFHRVKGFPNNLEIEVETTFGGSRFMGMHMGGGGGDGVADHRGVTLVVHYSLMKTPDPAYRPRLADDRVGHFLVASKDFAKADPDTNFVRQVTRWRLEKADPSAETSPPRKQIVWYIEDTVPVEYRPYVESGIREWNKAFEKVGITEAIAVRWQEPGRDEFDPEDTNYCTFRWVTSDAGFAMSCLRANPLTGEMIDGDVVFDASFIRHWKQEYALLVAPTAAGEPAGPRALAAGEVISPVLAARMGYGSPRGLGAASGVEAVPSTLGGLQWQVGRSRLDSARSTCQLHTGLSQDFSLAAVALADPPMPPTPVSPPPTPPTTPPAADAAKDKDKEKDKDADKDKDKKPAKPDRKKDELPKGFIGQAIKYIVMHEVGHSLGLRHNFKASTMLPASQLNDVAVTHAKGLVGSVMDYSPINIAPAGTTQGDFYTTTIGPYDYWAIEYAYKHLDGSEAEELKKIAARAPEADLSFATDEDMYGNGDPLVNVWDLGNDPCKYAEERIDLATRLLKELDGKVVKDGDSWARTRRAFAVLLRQWGDAAALASHYVGGQSVSRDHKGDKDAHDPIVPTAGVKQRECLKFLTDRILSDQSFRFSPALLRRLGTEKWMHWGSDAGFGSGVDISVLETVLAIQKSVLSQCLSPSTLGRLENQALQSDAGADPLRMDEVFRNLTDGVFSDLAAPAGEAKDGKPAAWSLSNVRRNLQREYLRRLNVMVLGDPAGGFGDQFAYIVIRRGGSNPVPADARALARLHLGEIAERIDKALDRKDVAMDDTTRAHLKECRQRIAKVLEAGLDARES